MAFWDDVMNGDWSAVGTDALGFLSSDAGRNTATGIGALLGLTNLGGSGGSAPVGYQGGIPHYKATRSQIPQDNNLSLTFSASPEVKAAQPIGPMSQQPVAARRPGSAGRRYFSDTVYTPKTMAEGGSTGRYLSGPSDGMADGIATTIGGAEPAALSHGEFVIPADVVSHLGNGNSDAGASVLHDMMDRVREARTGTTEQGKQINPHEMMPTIGTPRGRTFDGNTGVEVEGFDAGGTVADSTGKVAGTESSLSSWAGPYVTDLLGKGQALAEQPYQAYTGPLTAGSNTLQDKAATGIGSIDFSKGMGTYTPTSFTSDGTASKFMNPYIQQSLDPQLAEARRQSEISRINTDSRLTKAGAFGGSRQAIMDAENDRNLQTNLSGITGIGYNNAFNAAQQQFNTEEDRKRGAIADNNANSLKGIQLQSDIGGIQRGIESEGIAADEKQFEEERDDPYKKLQFQQSLLQGMPLSTQSTTYNQPSTLSNVLQSAGGIQSLYDLLFGNKSAATPAATPPGG